MDILFLQQSLKKKNSSSKPDMAICPFFVWVAGPFIALMWLTKEMGVMTREMRPFLEKWCTPQKSFIHHIILNPEQKYYAHIIFLTN